jgi:uncharacterized membrane protein
MGKSKAISIAVVGLVSGLLSTVPMVLAEDRDDIPRVRAEDATFIRIDFPGATFTAALDINSAGKIVGEYVSARDGNDHGFLRNRHGEFVTIDFPGANLTHAAGINSRGDIVGFYRLRGEPMTVRHGFLLSKGTFTTFDPPGSVFTNALGINRRGDIVGRYCTVTPCVPENRHGFLLSGASSRGLTSPAPSGPMPGGSMIAARSWVGTKVQTASRTSICSAKASSRRLTSQVLLTLRLLGPKEGSTRAATS